MPYQIKSSSGLIIVRHSGDVYCPELTQAADAVERLIDAARPPRLLIDVREARAFPEQEEFFVWLRQRRGRSPLVEELAFVTNKVHSDTIEAIALGHINRGISVRVFCGELEALQWLFRFSKSSQDTMK